MNSRYDGSSIDLEKALARYLAERRMSRRQLLDRIAKVGSVAALGPVIAACATQSSPSPSASASLTNAPSSAPTGTPAPTPVPTPEQELFIYNWTDYLAEEVIESFEEKYSVAVTQDFFGNTEEAYARLGEDGGGYDISFPISVDVPNFIERGAIIELDKSLLTNIGNLGAEWADPGYDPGNKYSVPYMWWTTGVAYDTSIITEELTSSTALWDPRWAQHILMLDDWQEAFGMTLIQLGHSANSTNIAEIDEAFNKLKEQKPLVRDYSTDTITSMTSGDMWIGQIWGADRFAIQEVNENVVYYIPEEGGVKGSDVVAIFSGAPHPIAAHLFINHLLDAQNSAQNTNLIYYMGPNEAAKEFIDPAILEDPTINPDKEIVDRLEELLKLEQSVEDEYLSRWSEITDAG
jgi:spermidine/putrescine transport system substrate-binding protein